MYATQRGSRKETNFGVMTVQERAIPCGVRSVRQRRKRQILTERNGRGMVRKIDVVAVARQIDCKNITDNNRRRDVREFWNVPHVAMLKLGPHILGWTSNR